MTKQDFELIARTIANLPSANEFGEPKVKFGVIVTRFADALHATNLSFDAKRFEQACCDLKKL